MKASESRYGCCFPDCTAHPAKGDTILRISPRGQDFVGMCEKHYPYRQPSDAHKPPPK